MASDEWIAENVKKDDDDVWERDDEQLSISEGQTLERTEEVVTREEIKATHEAIEKFNEQDEKIARLEAKTRQMADYILDQKMQLEIENLKEEIGGGDLVREMHGEKTSKDYSDNQLRSAGWSDEQIANLKGKSIEQLDAPLEPIPSKSKLNRMKKAELIDLANAHSVDITPKQDPSTGKTRPLLKDEIINRLLEAKRKL